jgi:hypothetical protein
MGPSGDEPVGDRIRAVVLVNAVAARHGDEAEHDVEHLNVRAAQVLDPDMAAGRPGDFHVPSPYSGPPAISVGDW